MYTFVIVFVFVFVFVNVFVVQVKFSHDPLQFCETGVWSGSLEGFEFRTMSE